MTLLISNEPVLLRSDDAGVVRVGDPRVSLDSVLLNYKNGATAEQIAFDFPTLELADIHAAIAYYLRHRDQVEEYLIEQYQEAAEVRQRIEPIVASGDIRPGLVARRAAKETSDAADPNG